MESTTKRPRVICHMAASIDGRILADGWPDTVAAAVRREYDRVHASYAADAWLCGRVTMEEFAGGVRSDEEVARQRQGDPSREDFVASGAHKSYAFAVDSNGRLAWATNAIGGDHVVAILSERVSDEYLRSLRERGVSYLLAGAKEIDLRLALERIAARFNVHTVMLEGGGRINGAFLRAGLVDEVSLLVVPAVDGRAGVSALFDAAAEITPRRLVLMAVERLDKDLLWLRYRVESTSHVSRKFAGGLGEGRARDEAG